MEFPGKWNIEIVSVLRGKFLFDGCTEVTIEPDGHASFKDDEGKVHVTTAAIHAVAQA